MPSMLKLHPILSLSNLEGNMVSIKGGEFLMGSERNDDEKPIHSVILGDYELCRYLVSQQLWYEVMGQNPEKPDFKNPHRPVEGVSWDDSNDKFLPALREQTGDSSWCLPTEAQWEYAARGGKHARVYTYVGSKHLKEVGWYGGNSFRESLPLSCKRPSLLGLYDMSGNVNEWCQDWYHYDYSHRSNGKSKDSTVINPVDFGQGGSGKVIRGGSWEGLKVNACVSARNTSYYGFGYVGFRLCRYSAC